MWKLHLLGALSGEEKPFPQVYLQFRSGYTQRWMRLTGVVSGTMEKTVKWR